MKAALSDDFLLETKQARALYHGRAARLPIVDYHNHLPPAEIAGDRRWENLARLWLAGDHYKWRLMRAAGVPERLVSGDAPDREKYDAFAAVVPQALRNPVWHWTHLELKNHLGVKDRALSPKTAASIWKDARIPSAREILKKSRVEVVCTTDDPLDSLEHHGVWDGIQVRPTWRPDKSWDLNGNGAWIERLGVGDDLDGYLDALKKRHDYFQTKGCRLSDRGVRFVPNVDCTTNEAARIFKKARQRRLVTPDESLSFQAFMMHELAVMDAEKGWVMQLHLGPIRNNNARLLAALGPDAGSDSIGDYPQAEGLSRHLDRLDSLGKLPRTILYNSNPRDNELFASMAGNFRGVQYGAAWWFLDQLDGMTRQLEALSQLGLLSRWVGMLTDSRSFTSFVRHEYFRRLLCDILGRDMARGRLPNDEKLIGDLVEGVCYRNARGFFGFYEDQNGKTRR